MKRVILVRSAIAMTAVLGLATPASAVVDLDVKRAIVGVVLDNLGVAASDDFVISIAQDLDAAELDNGLVNSVNDLLDTGSDPRSVIESQTDGDGDGVPDEGAALAVDDDDNAPNPNSTEKASNSDDKSGNSANRNSNGTTKKKPKTNSHGGGGDDDEDEEDEEDEPEVEDEPDDD